LLLALLFLSLPTVVSGVELGFVAIRSEVPLRIGPPSGPNGLERLGLRLRGLGADQGGEVVLTALADADGDGVVDDPAGREQWRRPLQAVRGANLATRPGELVSPLPKTDGEPFAQLVLTLRHANGAVIAGPAYLTPEPESIAARVSPALAGFGAGAWRALHRLVRIADVVRQDDAAPRRIFTLAPAAPTPAPIALADAPPRALALAPGGESVAWIAEDGGMDALWYADTGGAAPPRRILRERGPLTGLAYLDPGTVVVARDGDLLLVSPEASQAPRVVPAPIGRLIEIHAAQPRAGRSSVWVHAAAADDGMARPYRLDIEPDGRVHAAPLFELPVYELLGRTNASGRACFATPGGREVAVACIGPASTEPEIVARCDGATLVRAAAAAERIAFVARACP
jgi:hypothetical protein